MRKELLLRLADLLEADAANPNGVKFNLDNWAQDARFDPLQVLYDPVNTTEIPLDCRTAACAIGFAALSGAFKDEGLAWKISGSGYLIPTFKVRNRHDDEGFDAAASLFEINYRQAEYLFAPDCYVPTKGRGAELAVADRIRAFVNKPTISY